MLTTIHRLHRVAVDRIAELRWLRGRSGANAAWAHYERHAGAWAAAAKRHAVARTSARTRAAERHARARALAHQFARRGSPHVLLRWQAAIGRIVGATAADPGSGR
jgi:hypothetical protein